jgi:hypothetical protein
MSMLICSVLILKCKEKVMYIDPNTGGILFQTLAVLFGVFSGVILLFSSKIKMGIAKLRRSMRKDTEDTEPTEPKAE